MFTIIVLSMYLEGNSYPAFSLNKYQSIAVVLYGWCSAYYSIWYFPIPWHAEKPRFCRDL